MKAKNFLSLAGLAVVVAGCVGTVGGTKTFGVPAIKDRIEGKYERPANQVYDAAKSVLIDNGALLTESTLHGGTNAPVLALEGRVNQRHVWVSVQQVQPNVSSVIVQARTKGGGSDIELCHHLEKQVALKLMAR